MAREEVRDARIARLDVQGSIPKPEHIPVPVVAEVPPTDIASRSDTYTAVSYTHLTIAFQIKHSTVGISSPYCMSIY